MVQISVGQALLVLIDHHQKQLQSQLKSSSSSEKSIQETKNALAELKQLYLTGEKPGSDHIEKIISAASKADGPLQAYTISNEIKVIDEDPSRRYFETHLSFETLHQSLKHLDLKTLQNHLQSMRHALQPSDTAIRDQILSGNIEGTTSMDVEYADALRKLDSPQHYKGFSEEEREKIALLMKCSSFGIDIAGRMSVNSPLNIYGKGYFSEENRGRKTKADMNDVHSRHLGLMRSYMPVPKSDIATESSDATYQRPADKFSPLETSPGIKSHFATLVHPFSASLSGTLLGQLRAMLQLKHMQQFQLKDEKNFTEFIKSFTSALLYNSGGHSYQEFISLLSLPEVKREFNFMHNFDNLDHIHLLYKDNEQAFEKALQDSIQYNNILLNKRIMQQELLSKMSHEKTRERKFPPEQIQQKQQRSSIVSTATKHIDKFKEFSTLTKLEEPKSSAIHMKAKSAPTPILRNPQQKDNHTKFQAQSEVQHVEILEDIDSAIKKLNTHFSYINDLLKKNHIRSPMLNIEYQSALKEFKNLLQYKTNLQDLSIEDDQYAIMAGLKVQTPQQNEALDRVNTAINIAKDLFEYIITFAPALLRTPLKVEPEKTSALSLSFTKEDVPKKSDTPKQTSVLAQQLKSKKEKHSTRELREKILHESSAHSLYFDSLRAKAPLESMKTCYNSVSSILEDWEEQSEKIKDLSELKTHYDAISQSINDFIHFDQFATRVMVAIKDTNAHSPLRTLHGDIDNSYKDINQSQKSAAHFVKLYEALQEHYQKMAGTSSAIVPIARGPSPTQRKIGEIIKDTTIQSQYKEYKAKLESKLHLKH